MCFKGLFGGGGGDDGGAAAARSAEVARQAAINKGTTDVNATFSKFDDNYFGGVTKAYTDYYEPQVTDQYTKARKALVLALGQAGILNSSGGQSKLSALDLDAARQRESIASQGVSAAADARGRVEDSRSQLLSQLGLSADPTAAASGAIARAASLSAPPSFSPLGNLFANATQFGANQINGAAIAGKRTPSLFGASSSKGSARVVA